MKPPYINHVTFFHRISRFIVNVLERSLRKNQNKKASKEPLNLTKKTDITHITAWRVSWLEINLETGIRIFHNFKSKYERH